MSSVAELSQHDLRELVAFKVADQGFCVDIMSVREIRGWNPATVLPHAPDYVLGVINLRGSVVPIVDLALRLGLGPMQADERHVIIITVIGNQTVGLLVDAVSDILSVASSAIQPTPNVASDLTRAFVEGVIAIDDRMLRLIELETVLPAMREERA